MKSSISGLVLILAGVLLSVADAQAHKVTIFAWVEGNRVFTESKFSGGRVVKSGKVEVFDGSGQLLLAGQTDDEGDFSFEIPGSTDLDIVLTAGMGHQNSWHLDAAELGVREAAVDEKAPSPPLAPSEEQAKPPSRTDAPVLTAQAVEAIVARQLEQKLQPLTRMMAVARDTGPTVGEILGGIGYIIGLVGLGAYLRYRKDSRRS